MSIKKIGTAIKKRMSVESSGDTLATIPNAVLALDISAESVETAIASYDKNGNISIIGTGKAKQRSNSMHAGAIVDIPAVVSACEHAIADAETQAKVRCKLAVVGIAGELVKGNTTTVRYQRKNGNKAISEQEITSLIKRTQNIAKKHAQEEVALEMSGHNTEVCLVNSAIIDLSIDGCSVSNPVGLKGNELLIRFYAAFAPLVHVSAIEKVCAELSLDLLAVAVEPFAICRAILGDDNSKLSTIIMDVSDNITSVAVINNGSIDGTKMFNIGGRNFAKHKDFNTWIAGVQLALDDFQAASIKLPSKILLSGSGANSDELQEMLATTDWYHESTFGKRPLIELIDCNSMPGFNNHDDINIDCTCATTAGLLRVAIDTLLESSESNTIKEKIAKILQN